MKSEFGEDYDEDVEGLKFHVNIGGEELLFLLETRTRTAQMISQLGLFLVLGPLFIRSVYFLLQPSIPYTFFQCMYYIVTLS